MITSRISALEHCEKNAGTCQNGGTCVSLAAEDGDFKCDCPPGFTGRNCETVKVGKNWQDKSQRPVAVAVRIALWVHASLCAGEQRHNPSPT